MTDDNRSTGQRNDEVVTVSLSRRDEQALREMIDGYRSSGVVWKWIRNVLLVFASGVVALAACWEQIKAALRS
jgi:hypothetical protein